jgi:polysaccharide export outer membrane protein
MPLIRVSVVFGWVSGAVLSLGLLSGCGVQPQSPTSGFAPTTTAAVATTFLPSPIISSETQSLSPDELARISNPDPDQAYILGPDDQVAISVYLHPELSAPINASTAGNSGTGGTLITSDGTVSLPLLGSVKLSGFTIAQAQSLLTNRLASYVQQPQVTVELVTPQSLRYYLLGAFINPGVKYPVHPLNLLEALSLGGSVEIPSADLYQAYVAQGNVKLPVDLYALLVQGDLSQNIVLASGDVIVVPTSANENAFVFGAVTKSGPVPFNAGALSLLQALSAAQLDLTSLTNSKLSDVRIIRSSGPRGEYIIVNAEMILQGHAQSFDLRPGDIVFVPPSPVATWNQAISELIPSLTLVGDVLSPFVSIRYLTH